MRSYAAPSDIAQIYSPITIALPDYERRRLDTERRIAEAVMTEKRRVQKREAKAAACRHGALLVVLAALVWMVRR